METITCQEDACYFDIIPSRMRYGKDFYVLINLTNNFSPEMYSLQEMMDKGIVGIYCKDCGIIRMAEAAANGLEVISRK